MGLRPPAFEAGASAVPPLRRFPGTVRKCRVVGALDAEVDCHRQRLGFPATCMYSVTTVVLLDYQAARQLLFRLLDYHAAKPLELTAPEANLDRRVYPDVFHPVGSLAAPGQHVERGPFRVSSEPYLYGVRTPGYAPCSR